MQKTDKLAHAVKVVALCMPSVVMSLSGLAVLSRRKIGLGAVAGAKLTTATRPKPGQKV